MPLLRRVDRQNLIRAGFCATVLIWPALTFASDAVENLRRQVVGTWVAENIQEAKSPDGRQSAFLRSSVIFTQGAETLRVEAFLDRDLNQPLFTYESKGPYNLLQASPVIPGAIEANLTNESSLFTVHRDAPDIWKSINLGGCPLVVGKAVEISGCVSGPPFNTSGCVDQDLIHVEGNRLRFGDQQVDRCKQRPTTLDRTVFLRQEG
ncbi:MAG: hypothetical protein ING23_19370 [Roseomonas sp.]|jgi:hypothetical protein|nr:hypothetical protein [Burkholderiales bacterium]MCA3292578.1 hypothetical protein [Roseomonas sp.]MCA3296306.1 hypothetical protein [Roseomonas sp.]